MQADVADGGKDGGKERRRDGGRSRQPEYDDQACPGRGVRRGGRDVGDWVARCTYVGRVMAGWGGGEDCSCRGVFSVLIARWTKEGQVME